MSNINSLLGIGKPKAPAPTPTPVETPPVPASGGFKISLPGATTDTVASKVQPSVANAAIGLGKVPDEMQTPVVAPTNLPAQSNGGFKFSLPSATAPVKPPTPTPTAQAMESMSLEQLGDMEFNLDGEPTAPKVQLTNVENYQYENQAANAPDEVTRNLYLHLHTVANTLGGTEVSQALMNCLQYLDEHREFKAILMPDDTGMLVRALRSSYGRVITSKVERQQKKTRGNAVVNELLGALDGF